MTTGPGPSIARIESSDVPELCRFWIDHASDISPDMVLPDNAAGWDFCLSDSRTFWYCARMAGRLVAVGVLTQISGPPWSTADVGVGVAPSARGGGVGRTVLRALFRDGFAHGVARIQALVLPGNVASMRMVEGAGMVGEGISRGALERDGHRVDVHRWAILAGECV